MEWPCKMNHSLVLAFVGSFFTSSYSTAPDGKEIVAFKAYIFTTKLVLYRCFLEKKKGWHTLNIKSCPQVVLCFAVRILDHSQVAS